MRKFTRTVARVCSESRRDDTRRRRTRVMPARRSTRFVITQAAEPEPEPEPDPPTIDITDPVPVQEDPPTQPVPRRTGRPRNPRPESPPLVCDDDDEVPFSITITKRGAHIDSVWFRSFVLMMDANSIRYLCATERGGTADHLHIQCLAVLKAKADKAGILKLKKHIKRAFNITHGSGVMCGICIHVLQPGQTESLMLGYCTKDRALSHYQVSSKGYSEEEIKAGQAEHTGMKLSYMDGKIALNKTNMFLKAVAYQMNHLTETTTTFSEVLAEMMNSKKYMISPTVLMSSSGQMREEAAETYWKILMGKEANAHDVVRMMYIPRHPNARYYSALDRPTRMQAPAEQGDMGDYVPMNPVDDQEGSTRAERIIRYARQGPKRRIVDDSSEDEDDEEDGRADCSFIDDRDPEDLTEDESSD